MKLENEEIRELLIKYSNGACTEGENALLERWYLQFEDPHYEVSDERIKKLGAEVLSQLPGNKNNILKIRSWRGIAAVAACTLLAVGIWLYTNQTEKKQKPLLVNDVAPGGNHATLILANGRSISLSAAKSGIVIAAKQLTYNDGSTIAADAKARAGIQTITTPKGGQYQITLPDSTKVWLNAQTSLKFPATFHNSPNRMVELSGEAYFEVAKDRAHPFVVKSQSQTLEVLGTHFNIEAYPGENHSISTLLEGRVKINGSTLLKPGEQAVNNAAGIKIAEVDTDIAVAWKNGEFMFSREPLESIMRKIARWYDAEVVFQDQQERQKLFGGTISRFNNVSDVLNMLALTGQVHFKIEGRRITVMK